MASEGVIEFCGLSVYIEGGPFYEFSTLRARIHKPWRAYL